MPVAFLTNQGGTTEARKAAQLSELLGVQVDGSQVVLGHTAFRNLVPRYANEAVLIVGSGHSVDAARSYGFKNTVTTKQPMRAMPAAVPFADDAVRRVATEPQAPSASYRGGALRAATPANLIRAVLVFSEPNPWYSDLQLILDVVMGKGVPWRRSSPEGAPPVDVYFSHPDLLWSNDFEVPRLGQGAFAVCLEALCEKITGQKLGIKGVYGKPNPEAYELVEQALLEQAARIGLELPKAPDAQPGKMQLPPFSAIYGIGDNPEDIRGANGAGESFCGFTWSGFSAVYGAWDNPETDIRGAAGLTLLSSAERLCTGTALTWTSMQPTGQCHRWRLH